jgi:hypothetical protein
MLFNYINNNNNNNGKFWAIFGPKLSGSSWNPDYRKTTVSKPPLQLFPNTLKPITPIVFHYTITEFSTTVHHNVTQTTPAGMLGV